MGEIVDGLNPVKGAVEWAVHPLAPVRACLATIGADAVWLQTADGGVASWQGLPPAFEERIILVEWFADRRSSQADLVARLVADQVVVFGVRLADDFQADCYLAGRFLTPRDADAVLQRLRPITPWLRSLGTLACACHRLGEASAASADVDFDPPAGALDDGNWSRDRAASLVTINRQLQQHIARRRLAEDELRKSQQYVLNIIRSMIGALLVLSPSGEIRTVNAAACSMLGYDESELVGDAVGRVVDEESLSMDDGWPERLFRRGSVQNIEINLIARGDRKIPVLFSASVLRGERDQIEGIVCVALDLRDRKEAEAALRRSEEQLRQAQKMEAIGQLAGGIAHDFNNLLAAILANLTLLRGEIAPESVPLVDDSLVASQRAADLVGQLLTFSRRSPVRRTRFSIRDAFNEVARIVRGAIDRRIRIEVGDVPRDLWVRADAGQIQQVLLNLCINARDALETKQAQSPGADLRIRIDAIGVTSASPDEPEGDPSPFVRVDVADTGIGIDPESVTQIFEPFFTTKSVGKGTGLGLATAYGIIQQHGGWFEVETTQGMGATFRFFLPRIEPATSFEDCASGTGWMGAGETILVVDDEEIVRRAAKRVLESAGYLVIEAVDGQSALELVLQRGQEIDLVLLDLSMPAMSGQETYFRLQAMEPDLPVVLCTGFSLDQVGPNSAWLESLPMVPKPFTNERILREIQEVLAAPRQPKALVGERPAVGED